MKAYYQDLLDIATELDASPDNLFDIALTFPGVTDAKEDDLHEEEWKVVQETFGKALVEFHVFREKEGAALQEDLILRVHAIKDALITIEQEAPKRVAVIHDRLMHFLEGTAFENSVDSSRLEQELIFHIDRLDITEEIVRLTSHSLFFLQTLNSVEANGKKLGFIAQEMGREINTIGAKANDASIQRLVVGMKEELEKIKEQLLNVL